MRAGTFGVVKARDRTGEDRRSESEQDSALLVMRSLVVSIARSQGVVDIVRSVDLTVNRGEVVGISGESGSGKTLTALAILGLLPRSASIHGEIEFDGRNLLAVGRESLRQVRGGEIGFVFQDPKTSLHPMLTVERQITEHLQAHRHLGRRALRSRALELLDLVRLPNPNVALRSYPHQFSGGMRQRVAIAVALACDPKLLVADEPTTALDVTVQAQILELLESLRRERNLSVLLITHDLGVISAIADRLYVMYAGQVVENGPVTDLLQNPRHPYTSALLQALPRMHVEQDRLADIPGSPPQFASLPKGCSFRPRCAMSVESCSTLSPAIAQLTEAHSVRCSVSVDNGGLVEIPTRVSDGP